MIEELKMNISLQKSRETLNGTDVISPTSWAQGYCLSESSPLIGADVYVLLNSLSHGRFLSLEFIVFVI